MYKPIQNHISDGPRRHATHTFMSSIPRSNKQSRKSLRPMHLDSKNRFWL